MLGRLCTLLACLAIGMANQVQELSLEIFSAYSGARFSACSERYSVQVWRGNGICSNFGSRSSTLRATGCDKNSVLTLTWFPTANCVGNGNTTSITLHEDMKTGRLCTGNNFNLRTQALCATEEISAKCMALSDPKALKLLSIAAASATHYSFTCTEKENNAMWEWNFLFGWIKSGNTETSEIYRPAVIGRILCFMIFGFPSMHALGLAVTKFRNEGISTYTVCEIVLFATLPSLSLFMPFYYGGLFQLLYTLTPIPAAFCLFLIPHGTKFLLFKAGLIHSPPEAMGALRRKMTLFFLCFAQPKSPASETCEGTGGGGRTTGA
jgi:hypothetical protein